MPDAKAIAVSPQPARIALILSTLAAAPVAMPETVTVVETVEVEKEVIVEVVKEKPKLTIWQEASFTPDFNFGKGMLVLYKDLYTTIRDGAPLAITPESVRRQVEILERCREMSPV